MKKFKPGMLITGTTSVGDMYSYTTENALMIVEEVEDGSYSDYSDEEDMLVQVIKIENKSKIIKYLEEGFTDLTIDEGKLKRAISQSFWVHSKYFKEAKGLDLVRFNKKTEDSLIIR